MITSQLPATASRRVRRRTTAAAIVALAVAAAPALAQRHAQPRSGSSGGGSSSSSSASRGASGGSSSARSSGPSRSSSARSAVSRDGGSSSVHRDSSSVRSPHRDPGQPRHDGSHHHGHHHSHSYYPSWSFGFGYYSPYYYYPYAYGYPYYYGNYPYYGRRWGYHMPYGYPAEGVDSYYERQDLGAIALKVKPKTAEVYIDGRYQGTAGGFDGFPSYLWLEPGAYTLELVEDGYANLEREIEVAPGQVIDFRLQLEPGEAQRPVAGDEYARPDRPEPVYERAREAPRDVRPDPGRLVLEVSPDDASVYLDGRFIGTGREVSSARSPLMVEPGDHVLQVVHPDFETEERELSVEGGEETEVEITLRGGRV